MERVDRRGSRVSERSLATLAVGAALAFCWLARELILPAVLALFLAFTVHPVVAWLERRKVPHAIAALAGTFLTVVILAAIVALLYDRIAAFWAELPSYESRIRQAYRSLAAQWLHIQRQSEQLVKPRPGTVRVQQAVPWADLLLGTAQGALAVTADAVIVVFTLYLALAEGPRFREKLASALGRDEPTRQHAIAAVAEIQRDIESYIVNRLLLNAALGAVIALIYSLYGLEHATVWGLTTALLHFIPYVGPAVGLLLPTLMALLQYGDVKNVLAVAGIYVALVSLQGNVVDPLFLGKQLRLSPLVVFIGSLFWFWIWGPVGLFLAVPLLSAIRIACSHVPRLQYIAYFLGE